MTHHDDEAQDGVLSWRVLATSIAIVLWSILAYVGASIQSDVREIKQTLSVQASTIAVNSQRISINTEDLTVLKTDHREVRREVDQIKERLTIWQRLYNWKTP